MLVILQIILIINGLKLQFRGLIIVLLSNRAIRCNLRSKDIILLLIIIKTIELASLINLITPLIINLHRNLHLPSPILLFLQFNNSSIVPSTKRIKCIEDISLFEGFSPFKGFALRLIGRDKVGLGWQAYFYWRILVVQVVGNVQAGLSYFNHCAMRPAELLFTWWKFYHIYFALFCQLLYPCLLYFLFEI